MRTSLLIFLALFVACAFGVVKDPRHLQATPEQSQQTLAEQQSLQHVQAPVHEVDPSKAESEHPIPDSDEDATTALVSVSKEVDKDDAAKAPAAAPTSGSSWLGPVIALLIGLGMFVAFWVYGKREQ